MKHPTKLIEYGEMSAEVDVEIASLILDLWKLDITTTCSCQDNVPSDWVWIAFPFAQEAERFLSIVSEYSKTWKSMYGRILGHAEDDVNWKYSVNPFDYGVAEFMVDENTIDEEFVGPHDIVFSVSVRFPHKDLDEVKNRIHKVVKELK